MSLDSKLTAAKQMNQNNLLNSRMITPIKEEDSRKSLQNDYDSFTSKRSLSLGGSSSHVPKSHTYSANDRVDLAAGGSCTYSEIYESATRESIDETLHKKKCKGKRAHLPSESITWTHKYTSQLIEKKKVGWDELVNLEQLFHLQMINTVEYKLRKQKLVDEMTGTKVDNKKTQAKMDKYLYEKNNPPKRRVLGETEIIKETPDFNILQRERAIRHSCHIQKHDKCVQEVWSQDMRMVKMATNPFNNGTLRFVYYMLDVTNEKDGIDNCEKLQNCGSGTEMPASNVAKISIDPMEEYESYFHDVAMQKHAQRFADEFNRNEVPKKVGFLDCWVYELVDRSPHIFCGVEKYIAGDYHKYTNNWDWVNQTVDRNTPSAFSHFTYCASKHKILICDLQGVGDLYTDPQMHTYDGKGCGLGNMGQRGIDKFKSSHKCNAICTYLKLPRTNFKTSKEVSGTMPQKRHMNKDTIETLPVTTQFSVPGPETSKNTKNNATTSLLQNTRRNDDEEYSDDSDNGGIFGKRIDDDDDTDSSPKGEDTCCNCTVL